MINFSCSFGLLEYAPILFVVTGLHLSIIFFTLGGQPVGFRSMYFIHSKSNSGLTSCLI